MSNIPDAPWITRAEQNGYEPWLAWGYNSEDEYLDDVDDEEEGDDGDVYYGNETSGF